MWNFFSRISTLLYDVPESISFIGHYLNSVLTIRIFHISFGWGWDVLGFPLQIT